MNHSDSAGPRTPGPGPQSGQNRGQDAPRSPEEQAAVRRGQRTLLILFALFLAPVLAAVFLNSRWTDWQPPPTRNHGNLIAPVIPLGLAPTPDAIKGDQVPQWQLLYPVGESCGPECSLRVEQLADVRRSLGRHQEELQLVLVATRSLTPRDSQVGVWADSSGRLEALLEERGLALDGLLLVDPLGNLMMQFPSPVDDGGLGKDLDRLISHSRFQ